MPEVELDGVKFHVQRMGDGDQLVVFIHGLVLDNLSSWFFTVANQASKLAEIFLYDLRGHGRTQRPSSGYGVTQMVTDLAGLLDAEGVGDRPVDVVGNSFGGVVALGFAMQFPGRTASLALIDGHIAFEGWRERMVDTLSLDGAERDAMIAENFKEWIGRHHERRRTNLAKRARALVYDTTLLDDLAVSPVFEDSELARIECPVLALYGERSDIVEDARRLSGILPHCDFRVFPGCTHSIMWEATDEMRDQLLGWLARPLAER